MYEKENTQEITLLDMVNSLVKKWKLIVWVTLAALVLGAVVGLAMALIGNRNYGTRVEFFISSDKSNSYILSMVKSDSYAEALLMDENGLPGDFKDTQEYKDAKALLDREEELEDLIKEKEDELVPFDFKISKLSRESTEVQAAYNEAVALLEMYKKADGEILQNATPTDITAHFQALAKYEAEVSSARTLKEQKKQEYNKTLDEKQELEQTIKDLKKELQELDEDKELLLGALHAMYIGVEENADKVETLKKFVTSGFVDAEATEDYLSSSAVIYVDIAVPGDPETAEEILKLVNEKTVDFVEDSVDGDETVACTNLTAFATSGKIEVYNTFVHTAKIGLIAAVAAAAVMCVVIVAIAIIKPKKDEEIAVLEETFEPEQIPENADAEA